MTFIKAVGKTKRNPSELEEEPQRGAASGKTPEPDARTELTAPVSSCSPLAAGAAPIGRQRHRTGTSSSSISGGRTPSSCDGSDEYRNLTSWTRGPPTPSQTPQPRLPPPGLLSDRPEGSAASGRSADPLDPGPEHTNHQENCGRSGGAGQNRGKARA